MPFISLHTNAKISREQNEQIKTAFGRIISLIPEKREELLMLEIEGEKTLYFKGKNDGIYAVVSVNCFKNAPYEENRKFVQAVYRMLEQELDIASDHAYVVISEVPVWGTRGDLKR